ncbi:hypothetical protein BOX15_Mlig020476g2, partial [Macrostomum lignano]
PQNAASVEGCSLITADKQAPLLANFYLKILFSQLVMQFANVLFAVILLSCFSGLLASYNYLDFDEKNPNTVVNFCGRELIDAVAKVCDGRMYNSYGRFRTAKRTREILSSERMKKNVSLLKLRCRLNTDNLVQRCCCRTCTVRYLSGYCAEAVVFENE